MPEFQLDYGNLRHRFKACDEFTQGYIEAAFFCGVEDISLDEINLDMLADETWQTMLTDCRNFQLANAAALAGATAYEPEVGIDSGYSVPQAGRDFWYTRNGHGVGYGDRDLGSYEEPLEVAAMKAGECDLYIGDDGRLYI